MRLQAAVICAIALLFVAQSQSVFAQTTMITDVSYTKTALLDIGTQTPYPPIIVNATIGFENAKAGYYLAAGVFDLDDGNLVTGLGSSTPQPCSTTTQFAGCIIPLASEQGSERMQFSLEHPKGVWNLALIAAILDNARDPISSSFSDYTFTISVQSGLTLTLSLPGDVPVNVDGVNGSGSIQLVLAAGNHSVSVPEYVQVDNATRLRFLGWSDGSGAINRTVELDHDVTLTANYITQYRLQVISPLNIEGSGWYDKNATVMLSVESLTEPMNGIFGVLGGKWTFNGWSEGSNEISRSRIAYVVMNSPHVVKALWTPDYDVPAGIVAVISLLSICAFYVTRIRTGTFKTHKRRRMKRSQSHSRLGIK